MYVNVQPKLYWVTSRQAPEQFWVDTATTRAIHAFSNRDTSQYPEQDFLDHGDLAESYRSSYDGKTLPKGCIGKKGAGGDYYPTEEQLVDTLLHITAGVYFSCGGIVHMSPGNSMFLHAHLFCSADFARSADYARARVFVSHVPMCSTRIWGSLP